MTKKEAEAVKDECYKVMKKLSETKDVFGAILGMNDVFTLIDILSYDSDDPGELE